MASLRSAAVARGKTRAAAHGHARQARGQVKKAARHPATETAGRAGYVIRGLLYATIGVLALGLDIGRGQARDMKGAVAELADNPLGLLVLILIFAGLVGYAIWGYVRFLFDPLHRGSDASGWAQRLGFLWSGLSYTALLVFVAQFAIGSASQGDPTQGYVAALLNHRLGPLVVAVVGVIVVVAGLGQFVDAVKAGFQKDLKRGRHGASPDERRIAIGLGRLGMFARGVIFTMLGIFVVQAALQHDSSKVRTMAGAFDALAGSAPGHVLLAIVAVGFVALGLHSLAMARWVRMLSTSTSSG